jgi:hypothetical protein
MLFTDSAIDSVCCKLALAVWSVGGLLAKGRGFNPILHANPRRASRPVGRCTDGKNGQDSCE